MKKSIVILIVLLTVFGISNFLFAQDYVLKVNDYILTMEEYNSRVQSYNEDLSDSKMRNTIFNKFIKEVILKELLKENNLQVTKDDVYEVLKHTESVITSRIDDTYPLGQFNDKDYSQEKIMERLVSFEQTDFTYQMLKRTIEMNAMHEKLSEYYEKKAKNEFENGFMDKTLRKKYEELKENSIQTYQEMDQEQQEKYSDDIQKIKNMTFKDYKENNKNETIHKRRDELLKEAANRKSEELDIEENKKYSNQKNIINAVKNNNLNSVQDILNQGVDVNTEDEKGNTALLYAANNNSKKIAKLLIENGADVDAKNDKGVTSLMVASGNNSIDVAKLLIENGADVNAVNNDYITSLIFASVSNSVEVAQLLLKNGANRYSNHHDSWMARKMAKQNDHKEILELLDRYSESSEEN